MDGKEPVPSSATDSSFRSLRRKRVLAQQSAERDASSHGSVTGIGSRKGLLRLPTSSPSASGRGRSLTPDLAPVQSAKDRFLAAAARASKSGPSSPEPPPAGSSGMRSLRQRKSAARRKHERFVSGVTVRLKQLAMFRLDQRVNVRGKGKGTVRFLGCVHYAVGLRVGVALDEGRGAHDGFVRGKRYFHAPEKHGVIVKQELVEVLFDDIIKEALEDLDESEEMRLAEESSSDSSSDMSDADDKGMAVAIDLAVVSEEFQSVGKKRKGKESKDRRKGKQRRGDDFALPMGLLDMGSPTIAEMGEEEDLDDSSDSSGAGMAMPSEFAIGLDLDGAKSAAAKLALAKTHVKKRSSKTASVSPSSLVEDSSKSKRKRAKESSSVEVDSSVLQVTGAPYLYDSKHGLLSTTAKERLLRKDILACEQLLRNGRIEGDDLQQRLTFKRENLETSHQFLSSLLEHVKMLEPSEEEEDDEESEDEAVSHEQVDDVFDIDDSEDESDDGLIMADSDLLSSVSPKKKKMKIKKKKKKTSPKTKRVKTSELLFKRNERALMEQFEKLLDTDAQIKNLEREVRVTKAQTTALRCETQLYDDAIHYGMCAKDEAIGFLTGELERETKLLGADRRDLRVEQEAAIKHWLVQGSKDYLKTRCTVRADKQTSAEGLEQDDSDSDDSNGFTLALPF